MEPSAYPAPPHRNRVKGLYISLTEGEGPASMRFAVVESTPRGTLIVRGEADGAMRVILSHLTESDLDAIINGVCPAREIA